MTNSDNSSFWQHLKNQLIILGCFGAVFWVLEIVDYLFLDGSLDACGVSPRTTNGLRGIALAPFLHGDFAHLAGNTIPFIVLGWFIMLSGIGRFFVVFFLAMVIGGLGIWMFGSSDSVHIGASGVIFGFLGFLIISAYFARSFKAILLSIIAGGLYGGFIWGILPGQQGISWEGHLFGFLGGIVAARILAAPNEGPKKDSKPAKSI
ncbi:MAG: rhomboid family intramembrane serine protease [Proteobacteria bacterium]|nr:rhomboid family intramembrane serine protease [Pseudomonadota bacterium]